MNKNYKWQRSKIAIKLWKICHKALQWFMHGVLITGMNKHLAKKNVETIKKSVILCHF